ncbi:MAG: hypothetical protein WA988_16880, partial [Candidatus Nanopelagicales bacterium]
SKWDAAFFIGVNTKTCALIGRKYPDCCHTGLMKSESQTWFVELADGPFRTALQTVEPERIALIADLVRDSSYVEPIVTNLPV